jgi:hypothetical protein
MTKETKPQKFWIVSYHHRHGVDVWPVFQSRPPTEKSVIRTLDDWEPDREEYIEISRGFEVPAPKPPKLKKGEEFKRWTCTGEKLCCPKCGGTDEIGRNETVPIRQDVRIDEKGHYEFTGNNEVFWEGSEFRPETGEREWWCCHCSIEFDAPNLDQLR